MQSSYDILNKDRQRAWWLIGAALVLGCATVVSILFWDNDRDRVVTPVLKEPEEEPETEPKPASESLEQDVVLETPLKLIPEYTPPVAPAQENLPPVAALPPIPALPPPRETQDTQEPSPLEEDSASPAVLRPALDFPAEDAPLGEPLVERAELIEPAVVPSSPSHEPEIQEETVIVETLIEPEPVADIASKSLDQEADKPPPTFVPVAESEIKRIPPEDAPPDEAPVSRATQVFLELAERAPDHNALIGFLSRHRRGPSPDERRRGVERLNCSVVCICVSTAMRWEVEVVNLGVGGLEMKHPEDIPLKTRLAVVPHHYNQTVTGRVVWSKPGEDCTHLGFAFDLDHETLSQTWVASLLLEQGAEFLLRRAPRKYVRVNTEIQSLLVQEDGTTIAITLRDVSLGGCLVHSEAEFGVEELTLMLGTVACRGIVVKHRQNRRGWSYHIRFRPLGFLEKARLRRTITLLLKAGS